MALIPQVGRTELSQQPETPGAAVSASGEPAAASATVQTSPAPTAVAVPAATRLTLLNPVESAPSSSQPVEMPAPEVAPAATPAPTPSAIAEPKPELQPEQSVPTPLTEIVLRLRERYLYVKRDGTVIAKFPVAIGAPETPTPKGTFQITNKLKDPVYESTQSGRRSSVVGPNSPIGDRWLGFHHQGNNQFGFHGTPWPYWVDVRGAVSHGCVRLKHEHVRKLYELVAVGDTVKVTD